MAGIDGERSIYNHLMEVMERLEQMEENLKQEKTKRKDGIIAVCVEYEEKIRQLKKQYQTEIEEKDKETSKLRTEVALLRAYKARHESNDSNNSSNSLLPTSIDQRPSKQKAPNEYNGRTKTGKKNGGQVVHIGKTLRSKDILARLDVQGIKPEIQDNGKPSKVWKERLVIAIPPGVKATIQRYYADENGKFHIPPEFDNEVTYGENLKDLCVSIWAGSAVTRTDHVIAGRSDKNIIQLSQGTVCKWVYKFHKGAEEAKSVIKDRLLDHHQVSTDGTCVSLNGCQLYIRNFSVKDWVLYVSMGSKGYKALSEISFLHEYAGILMHDHESGLYRYGTEHAECNVHLLRYPYQQYE